MMYTNEDEEATAGFVEWVRQRKNGAVGVIRRAGGAGAEKRRVRWILDSGASQHLVPEKFSKFLKEFFNVNALLDTVKGEVQVKKGAKVAMPGMAKPVDAWLLQDTPLCATMGLLIEKHGFRIDWRAGCCKWIDPDGNVTVLQVEDDTPIAELELRGDGTITVVGRTTGNGRLESTSSGSGRERDSGTPPRGERQ